MMKSQAFALATTVFMLVGLASCVNDRGNPWLPTNPGTPPPAALAISPDSTGITVGTTVQFTVQNMDTASYAQWGIESGVGTISGSGLFTAPSALVKPSVRTRIVVWDRRDTTKRAWAIVDLTDPNFVPPVDTTICFTRDIMPLIRSNCAMSGCHDGNDGEARSLLTYGDIQVYLRKVNGKYVPERSKLYTVLSASGEDRMPRNAAPLTDAQQKLIRSWINQGAVENDCPEATCDTSAVTYADVAKILTTNCTGGCHSGVAPSGGIDLTQESVVKIQVTVGTLIATIEQQPGVSPMPQSGGKLSDCDIARIRTWARTVK